MKKKNKIIFTLSIILFTLIIIGGSLYYFLIYKKNKEKAENKVNIKEVTEPNEDVEEYSFSLVAVGDALIHNGVYNDANTYKVGSDGYYIYDFNKMFTYIADIVSNYDLAFYNQETIIGGKNLGLSNYPMFNSPDEIGKNLVSIGFNLVNLATNHTLDKYTTGALYSRKFWKAQDAYVVGSYDSWEDRNAVVVKEKNGITYAMLGYTYGTNGIPVPSGKEYLVNVWSTESESEYQAYKAQVKKDIEAVRDQVDVLIVSMHWGVEYTHTPTWYQQDAAKYLASLGVDVIIGTHPHVIQPITWIDDTLVIYSLGNFISAQSDINTRVGMIAGFTVNKTVDKEGNVDININDVKADLLWTYQENYRNFKVIPFSKLTAAQLWNKDTIWNQYSPIINQYDKSIQVGFVE